MSDTFVDPECEAAREAMSAHLDGETSPVAPSWLTGHVVNCPQCRGWFEAATELQRRARLTLVPTVPDLTDRILAATTGPTAPAPADRRRLSGVHGWLPGACRVALAVVAAAQLWVSLPVLLFAHDHDVSTHPAHELGSFNTAVALGLLAVAWRPRFARGMRPLLGATAALLVITAVVDVVARHTTVGDESPHLLVVLGYVLLLFVSRDDGRAAREAITLPTAHQLPARASAQPAESPMPDDAAPVAGHGGRATA